MDRPVGPRPADPLHARALRGRAGGWTRRPSLAEAEAATYKLFAGLKKVALTRNVLLPVGTDYTPPNKWVTEIHRDWNARYTWPRFVCALPREFFAAVRAELDDARRRPSPQTRDMNPIYTGKDVSYIDTKQAQRAAEDAVLDAERFAVFAGLLGGATYPHAALAKAWVQLAYGAHHDAITGSESDQVYLDLLTGWRDAWELGRTARDNALALLSGAVDGSVVVWNPLAHDRTDVVTVRLDEPLARRAVVDTTGRRCRRWSSTAATRSAGWPATCRRWAGAPTGSGRRAGTGWEAGTGNEIANEHYRLRVDPARGGGVTSLVEAAGRELIADGRGRQRTGGVRRVPGASAGRRGAVAPAAQGPGGRLVGTPADGARPSAAPLGERLVVRGRIGGLLRYTQTVTLWHGVDRVDCRTTIDEFTGADRLLRVRWPCPVPGAMPVSEVGDAVIGRGFGLLHDAGPRTPWTPREHP